MFTGIVETTGKVISKTKEGSGIRLSVQPNASGYLKSMKVGDSMTINGACMTRTLKNAKSLTFDTMAESLKKTNLGLLNAGRLVNRERSIAEGSRFDGQLVQGNVDTTGTINKINKLEGSWEIFVEFPKSLADSIIYVGSISIDGISLTVAEILKSKKSNAQIKVAIIPHTLKVTKLGKAKPGDVVTIEFDMIGKYIKRILENNKLK